MKHLSDGPDVDSVRGYDKIRFTGFSRTQRICAALCITRKDFASEMQLRWRTQALITEGQSLQFVVHIDSVAEAPLLELSHVSNDLFSVL